MRLNKDAPEFQLPRGQKVAAAACLKGAKHSQWGGGGAAFRLRNPEGNQDSSVSGTVPEEAPGTRVDFRSVRLLRRRLRSGPAFRLRPQGPRRRSRARTNLIPGVCIHVRVLISVIKRRPA